MVNGTLAHGEPLPDGPAAGLGRAVGPYLLQRRLGEGGMGEVWLAEQTEPIRRMVALKLIKAGMDTRRVVARFEAERQALALMEHPAIARVLDGGSTAEGRPYFVMELVSGVPLHQYCDEQRLTTRQRLELFLPVCEGVQHAHQKAIIHRDLKPSNVLVATVDGKPQPRIIDFGIAKATGQRLSENALTTEYGAVMGTPEYMSPEQADPTSEDVDTRADVYALGVMLYELLTGALPFTSKDLRGATPQELRRRLLEVDPPPPSARLRTPGEGTKAAERRSTPPDTLAGELRGDLDAIVMKAMEKERERRYASAADLGADIGRALRNEPVQARPASANYRLKKYVRRHRAGVALGTAAALTLPAFTVALALQVRAVSAERDRANREAAAATRIADFLSGIFKVSDPSEARGNSITAREVLDKAAREIESGLDRDPELQARLMGTMGSIYVSLGLYPAARPLLQRALDARTRLLGPDAEETLRSRLDWGRLLFFEGRHQEAEPFDRESVERCRRALGAEHRFALAAAEQTAGALIFLGRYTEAETLSREVLEVERRIHGPDAAETLASRMNLALIYTKQRRLAEAAVLRTEVLELHRRLFGPDHPKTVAAAAYLGGESPRQDEPASAERLLQALESARRVYGPEHPVVMQAMTNLANVLAGRGRYGEAEKVNLELLAIERRARGPGGYWISVALYNLLCEAALQNHRDDALRYLREAVAVGLPGDAVEGIDRDSDLASLRGDPAFEALVAQAKAAPGRH